MKPDWDKLMKFWNKGEKAKTSLIADVDCTTDGGKPLCETHGVTGYPTIMWGDPNSLQNYEGERTYKPLKTWANENLKPSCGISNLDLCSEAKKKEYNDILAMSDDDLDAKVKEKEKGMEDADATLKAELAKLEEVFEVLKKEKEDKIEEVKKSGLMLMKYFSAMKKASGKKDKKKKKEL